MESKPDPKLLFCRVSGRKTGSVHPFNQSAGSIDLGKEGLHSWKHSRVNIGRLVVPAENLDKVPGWAQESALNRRKGAGATRCYVSVSTAEGGNLIHG